MKQFFDPIRIDPEARAERMEGLRRFNARYAALKRGHMDIVSRLRSGRLSPEKVAKNGLDWTQKWRIHGTCSREYSERWEAILRSDDVASAIESSMRGPWGDALAQNSALFDIMQKEFIHSSYDALDGCIA